MTEEKERTLSYKEEHGFTEPPVLPREWQMMILIGFFTVLIKLAFFTSDSNVIYYAAGFGGIAGINALGCALSWNDSKDTRIKGFVLAILSYVAFIALMYLVITTNQFIGSGN